jgi:hypothetical protein
MPSLSEMKARAQSMEREQERTRRNSDVPPEPAVTTPDGRPVWYPPDAILTVEDVAAVLDVAPKTVRRFGIRKAFCSGTTVRYLFRDVVAFLDERAA